MIQFPRIRFLCCFNLLTISAVLPLTVRSSTPPTRKPKFAGAVMWPTYVKPDAPLVLQCIMDPDIPFVMNWLKNGTALLPSYAISFGQENETLSIQDPKPHDSGKYSCVASNRVGRVNHTQNILVQEPSHFTRPVLTRTNPPSGQIESTLGSQITIECRFSVGSLGLFENVFQWLKNSSQVNDTKKHEWNITDDDAAGAETLSLTISNLTRQDLGEYKCFAKNHLGNDSATIEVKLAEKGRGKAFQLWSIIVIAVSGVFVITAIPVISTMILRRRKQKYEELKWDRPDTEHIDVPEREVVFDVFISYSSEDEEWVKNILFEFLRTERYSVCIHFKDFTPGMAIAENIMDALYKSRKTIVVMSKHFIRSVWGQFELQQAFNKAMIERDELLIVVRYDKCKFPAKLIGKTYLDWVDRDAKAYFWDRLKDALGPPADFTDLINNERNTGLQNLETTKNPEARDELIDLHSPPVQV